MIELTAVYEHVDGWWIGWVEETPGTNLQQLTVAEAGNSLADVAQLILDVNRSLHPIVVREPARPRTS